MTSTPAPGPGAEEAAAAPRWSRPVALVVAAAFFMENLDATILSTATASVARDFGVQPAQLGIAVTGYLVAVAAFIPLGAWLAEPPASAVRWRLSTGAAPGIATHAHRPRSLDLLSGPEGGLSAAEAQLAERAGFVPVSLGPRTLRADTAPLAALACIALRTGTDGAQP